MALLTKMTRSAVETETPSPGCSEQDDDQVSFHHHPHHNQRSHHHQRHHDQVSRHLPVGSSQFPTGETLHTELEDESGHGSVTRKATSPRQSSRQVSSPRPGSIPGQSPKSGSRLKDEDCERPLGENAECGDQHR